MVRIQVREISKSISDKLSEQSKQLGYSSRDEYLRDVLEKVAKDDWVFHSDARYEIAMANFTKHMQVLSDILYVNVQLGLLRSPFEFDQEGNIINRKTYTELMAEETAGSRHGE